MVVSHPSSGFARPPDPTTRWKIFAAPLGGNKYHPPGSYLRWPGARTQTEVTRFLSHAPRLVESNLSRHTSQVRTACPDYPVSGFFPSPGLLSPATVLCSTGIQVPRNQRNCEMQWRQIARRLFNARLCTDAAPSKGKKGVGLRSGCVRRLVPRTFAKKKVLLHSKGKPWKVCRWRFGLRFAATRN